MSLSEKRKEISNIYFILGYCYYNGKGLQKDLKKAVFW
jgi:TPR repeat protein